MKRFNHCIAVNFSRETVHKVMNNKLKKKKKSKKFGKHRVKKTV